jgi:hypothetical protein
LRLADLPDAVAFLHDDPAVAHGHGDAGYAVGHERPTVNDVAETSYFCSSIASFRSSGITSAVKPLVGATANRLASIERKG